MDEVIVMRLMMKKLSYLFTILLVVFLSGYTNVNNKIWAQPAQTYTAAAIDSTQQLADAKAHSMFIIAKAHEPMVTTFLKSYTGKNVKLSGLEHSLKSEKSLSRKLVLISHTKHLTIDEAALKVEDVLRYTFVSQDKKFVRTTKNVLRTLTEDKGYKVKAFSNSFGTEAYHYGDETYLGIDPSLYKGINVALVSPEGINLEIQFHSEKSYAMKERTHGFYEIIRSEKTTPEEKAKAREAQRQMNAEFHPDKSFAKIKYPF
jgi:hypothetical protein